ncbi:MAG: Excinuclease ABC C subunit domain protein [Parcubacteria group bacterium GW2011_GWE2_39_37]|uniref:Excinuclease ABC C subunit domain protein n=1 Tax=Candidatus Falkowbacteria bacterium GW2011_GWF2_39_8 TaxID=1618642 RepID=A0A0G0PSR3_9BACT|nr:MAG: Excinuclease ABC C subunit domain protein [Parcubacteria group bacterium GW2011_GWE2_39_37]KKR31204.1 MAG: Excinuclease ABC C subunit domain protein [Candidatus Falkowbacteria bacterium GW2011_GWF2_39_8]
MPREHIYYIYILTNINNLRFYIGVTNNLLNRYREHKNKKFPDCFTAKYNINKIVYYEIFGDVEAAINREKELKKWRREKKIDLIKTQNIKFNDLINDFLK